MTVNIRIKNGDQPHLRLGSYNLMSGQYLNCISYQPPENGLGEGLALPIQGFRGGSQEAVLASTEGGHRLWTGGQEEGAKVLLAVRILY